MNWKPILTENPLENLLDHGGYTGIFRTIACIGDSLSSGEFEGTAPDGSKTYHDLYDYSWGQYLARMAGCKAYNFSRGGMTAHEYLDSFADTRGFWNVDLAAQAYIVAMGANDITAIQRGDLEFGGMDDIDAESWRNNARTFAGNYAALIQRYRAISPDSFFFLMTMPRMPGKDEQRARLEDEHQKLMYQMAEKFPNTFVIDLRRYAPVYDDEFKRNFFLGGHMNPMGYMLTAKMTATYIDHIIRSDMRRFGQVGFVGTPWKNTADV